MSPLNRLRDLFAQPPTRRRWDTLCDLLEDASAAELPLAFDYALDHLESWPDALREAPGHWLAAAARGEPAPLLALARSFQPILEGLQPLHATITTVPNPSALREQLLTPRTFKRLLALPELAGLRALSVRRGRAGEPGDLTRQLLSLAAAPLEQLRSLSLQGRATPQAWAALLEGSGRTVERWQLDSVELSAEVVAALEQAQGLAPWRELTLRSCAVTPEALGRLLRRCAPTLEALEVTAFSRSDLKLSRDLPAAFAGLRFPRLRRLHLSHQDFTPATLALLGDPERFPALDDLELTSCGGEERLEPLLRGGLAARLREVKLGPPAAARFAEALEDSALPQLRRLACFGKASQEAAIKLLQRASGLERVALSGLVLTPQLSALLGQLHLRELDVSQCTGRLDMSGLLSLGRFRPTRLRLVACGVDSADLHALAASDALSDLRTLNLAGAELDDASLKALMASPCRESLEEALLYASSGMTAASWTLAFLRDARPLRLHTLSLTPRAVDLPALEALLASPALPLLDDLLVGVSAGAGLLGSAELEARWSAAPLPLHVKGMPFAGHWGWGVTDLLRLPPSQELLKLLEQLLKAHPPLLPQERALLERRVARWWPQELRGEALNTLNPR